MNLLTIPIIVVVQPAAFLSIYHTISGTRTSFAEHYINLMAAMFATSGVGFLISTTVRNNKYVVAVGVILVSVSECVGK